MNSIHYLNLIQRHRGKRGENYLSDQLNLREQKKRHARNKIISTALSLFASRGFVETTIADIMKEAQLGTGTFYNYFTSKEEILNLFIAEKVKFATNRIDEIMLQDITATQKLLDLFRVVSETFEKDPMLQNFFVQLFKLHYPYQSPANHGQVFRNYLLAIINEGIASGEFREDTEPDALLELLHGITLSSMLTTIQPVNLATRVDYKLTLVLTGIQNKRS